MTNIKKGFISNFIFKLLNQNAGQGDVKVIDLTRRRLR